MASRRLVGRARELGVLHGFVDAVATEGGSLLVVGEAGVGKTSLLDAAAAHAAELGTRVLRASGVEFEAEVSFAGLHQLVAPLAAELAVLPLDSRRAIGVAVGLAEGPAPDQLALTNALLALLSGAADQAALLVVVDDLQWLDRASATLFGILARRLGGTGIGLLGVVRTGEGSVFEDAGLAEIAIGPLDDDAAAVLLTEAFPELPPRAARQVLTEAQGNPLALIELPAHVGPTAAEPPLGRTSVGRRLQLTFARRIDGLPNETRAQLLLAALDGTGELFPAISVGELEPAERARLIRIHPVTRGVQFRHPLTRSAVVELSTEEERREAHRRLAGRHPAGSERRAWHLAEAASAPDEQIAQLLEEAALKTKGRGDPVGAIGLLLRAAELSPGPDDHHRRAMFATYLGADVTGDLTDPRALVAERGGQGHTVAAAVAAAAYMVNSGGDIDTIHRLLLGALRKADQPIAVWDAPLSEIVYVLQANCSFGSRAELVDDYRAALDRLDLEPPEILALLGNTFLEPARRAAPSLPLLDEAIAGIGEQADHAHAVRLGIAAMYVHRIAGCRSALWRVIEHGRSGGAVASAIKAFALLGFDGVLSGDWDGVLQLAEEGLAFTTRHHYRLLGGFLQYDRAMVAAARGDRETVRHHADDLEAWGAPNRIGFVLQLAAHAKAVDALSNGEFETAYRHAVEICSPGTVPAYKPAALWVLLDLVEAAVRAGRTAEARAHVADIHRSGVADLSPRLALIAVGATGMTAPAASFREAFDTALATPGASRWPFAQARIRLAYAERLRRAKSTSEARHQLTIALDVFERLGAVPWAARARAELRASGTPAAHPASGPAAPLTPQEREIAELAAAGLTNKQIGERLYLSPRTVSSHLYRLFPKLGISSRAALRDALGELPPTSA
ncbi:DNA-binding CsgD family transcriptional regulator [Streptacidiphilus sp. MAP12-16]|uniref:helix-turn-helix transcriptional regulator n=1 Tax=Streptacidiphilus sp. MAP12-16 TaxID=3156300 RepID=UPI0035157AE9